jgi:putative heme iron utilization protein
MKKVSLCALLTVLASSGVFAQSDISPVRAAAIRECNDEARPYASFVTWGNWQFYIYRACMARHGQVE